MTGFRVGLADLLIYTGLGPMAMTRANYLAAAATRIDSFWVLLLVLFPAAFTRRSGLALGGATAIAEPSERLGNARGARARIDQLSGQLITAAISTVESILLGVGARMLRGGLGGQLCSAAARRSPSALRLADNDASQAISTESNATTPSCPIPTRAHNIST